MSAEARYFRVGLFVFVGLVLIGSCAVILGGRDLLAEPTVVETYFEESVQGLEVGSPVKFRGVKLGSVSEIGVVSDYYRFATQQEELEYGEKVLVRLEVFPTRQYRSREEQVERVRRMIEKGLRLRLTSQGITGTSFIQGDYLSPEKHPPMKITWTPEEMYIPSAPSTLATLTTAAERIMGRLEDVQIEKVVEHVDQLVLALTRTVDQLEIAEVQGEAMRLLGDLRATNRKLGQAIEDAELASLSAGAQQTLADLDATLLRLRQVVDGSEYDLQASLENIRVATENLRDLTDTARSYPSLLLFGEAPESREVSSP